MELARITETGIEIVDCDVQSAEQRAAKALQEYETLKASFEEVKTFIEAQEVVSDEEKESLENLQSELRAKERLSENATKNAIREKERHESYISNGFLPFVSTEQPEPESDEFKAVDSYSIEDSRVMQAWKIQLNEKYIQKQIEKAKQDLAATDYKVMKCYEASLVGDSLPYDIEQLHASRQALRDQINTLENTINENL